MFVNERESGYLGTFPKHNPALAREYVRILSLGRIRSSSVVDFDTGLNPRAGWFCIGAYPGAAVFSGLSGLSRCTEEPENPLVKKIVAAFPNALLLATELASANNYFGYTFYERGVLQRALAGDADRGVVVDTGNRQAEEDLLGERKDYIKSGETLVFSLSKRFFGCSLDKFAAERLTVEVLRTRRPIWPFSLMHES